MGTIDTNRFTLTCEKCGNEESVSVHEKGSSYGSSWQHGPAMEEFIVQWQDQGIQGPIITKATCKSCKIAARIDGPHFT